jgi:hypothetical protein
MVLIKAHFWPNSPTFFVPTENLACRCMAPTAVPHIEKECIMYIEEIKEPGSPLAKFTVPDWGI